MDENVKNGKVYGCHVDLDHGVEPDECVIADNDHGSCMYAILPSGRKRRSKWTCQYWKALKEAPIAKNGGQS